MSLFYATYGLRQVVKLLELAGAIEAIGGGVHITATVVTEIRLEGASLKHIKFVLLASLL